jgi:monooxygenase
MEHVDVLVVGAGISGIAAAHHIGAKVPGASVAIVEARDRIGGTWDLFRYPGIRSDSDMFTLGYSFKPWDGDKTIAGGADIRDYVERTAREDGTYERIRFGHRITSAAWSTADACWRVSGTSDDGPFELTCGFLFCCTGYYRYDHGHQPAFAGTDDFGGTLVHPQQWPEDLDVTGKRVVVIGSGATAVTLVPALAERAAHVTMLQRSPTYIASMPAASPVKKLTRFLPKRWAPVVVRWALALMTQASYQLSRRRPDVMKRFLRGGLERALPPGYDIDTHFTPTYDPWDQRLCVVPDGDLFKAITAGLADVVTDTVDTFTPTGVRLCSGRALDADVVVSATGLETLFLGGIDVTVDGETVVPAERLSYKGVMMEGVPNLAFAFGYTNASWTLKAELTCDQVTKLLRHLRATGLRQCTPVNDDATIARRPFIDLTSGYVQRSIDRFPKSGDRFPWQVHQSYLRDFRALRLRGVDDAAMRFTNPAPVQSKELVS